MAWPSGSDQASQARPPQPQWRRALLEAMTRMVETHRDLLRVARQLLASPLTQTCVVISWVLQQMIAEVMVPPWAKPMPL